MLWTPVEAAMKGMTFAGVILAALLLTRAGPSWSRRVAMGLALAGVALMVVNAILGAGALGLGVDALYLGLALATATLRARAMRHAPLAPEPVDGGEAGS